MTWATSRIWLPGKATARAEKRNSTMPGKNANVELRCFPALRPAFRQALETSRYASLNTSSINQSNGKWLVLALVLPFALALRLIEAKQRKKNKPSDKRR
nr:hypothetical protein [Nitrosomonas nitrosa]